MAFTPVPVTDGVTIRLVHSSAELAQAIWDGWWDVQRPPAPLGPTMEWLKAVELQLQWLITNPILATSFAAWYAAHSGSTPAEADYELLTESLDSLVTEDGTLLVATAS